MDQSHVGKPGSRKVHSGVKPGDSQTPNFHRFLISNQAKQADDSHAKTSGLTIADYLANPVRVTCQYRYLATSRSFEKKKTKADNITELPTHASTKAFAEENAVSSHKEKIGLQRLGRSDSKSSLSKSGDIERLRIEKSIRKAAKAAAKLESAADEAREKGIQVDSSESEE